MKRFATLVSKRMQHEESKVGKVLPDPNRHEAIEFFDQESGYKHEIRSITEETAAEGQLNGELVVSDEHGVLLEPVAVILPKQPIVESRPLRIYLKEHKKQIAAGSAAAISTVVAIGSLVIWHRRRS